MKKFTKIVLPILLAVALLFTASCTGSGAKQYTGKEGQGVTVANGVTTVKIGNTAATTGIFAGVGVPFNYGLEAYLWYYSTVVDTSYKFEFVHYDDEFTAEKGLTYTKQLVEQDKIFALVGHFGTNTIEATADYIVETGIPMAYAATGVSALYNPKADGYERAIMPVQPIYNTEGRSLLATAVAPTTDGIGLGGKKIGVVSTTDDAGMSILAGIQEEAKILGIKNIEYQSVDAASGTDYSAAVNALKKAGCDVVIIAANQAPFSAIATQFISSNYDNVKILTSYVSANGATMGALAAAGVMTDTRKCYAGAWLDIIDKEGVYGFSADYWTFATIMNSYEQHLKNDATAVSAYGANSYAMAGYIAGVYFCEGLTRVKKAGTELNWKNYIEAMESEGVTIPMTKGVQIDLSKGQRLGITALSLTEYAVDNAAKGGASVRGLTLLADIEAAYKK